MTWLDERDEVEDKFNEDLLHEDEPVVKRHVLVMMEIEYDEKEGMNPPVQWLWQEAMDAGFEELVKVKRVVTYGYPSPKGTLLDVIA